MAKKAKSAATRALDIGLPEKTPDVDPVGPWRVERRFWTKRSDRDGFDRGAWETVKAGDEAECRAFYEKAQPPLTSLDPIDFRIWDGDHIVGQKTR